MNDFPPVMNIHEAADVLRVSVSTVRRLIRARRLRAVRLGARVLITRQALEELLELGASEGATPLEKKGAATGTAVA